MTTRQWTVRCLAVMVLFVQGCADHPGGGTPADTGVGADHPIAALDARSDAMSPVEAGMDVVVLDTTPGDTSPMDAPILDASPMDAPILDASPMDAPILDASPMDTPPRDVFTTDTAGDVSTCAMGQTTCSGSCVDLATDTANCGRCGTVCGAGQVCSAGVCACPAGRAQCGAGCVDLSANIDNCGRCGVVCGDHQGCIAGVCRAVCPVGRTACSGACVDLLTDAANCGSCGGACGAGQVCSAGACACPAGQVLCGGSCVDLSTDAANCGRCSGACPAGQSCVGGMCSLVCAPGQTVCGGQCVDTANDRTNCGGCGTVCATDEVCATGACGCPAGQQRCRGSCVTPQPDGSHCVLCGVPCGRGLTCTFTPPCAMSFCPAPNTMCGSTCTNTSYDRAHCGSCSTVCPNNQTCISGICGCRSPTVLCGGTCVNTASDVNNCGTCAHACARSQACMSGVCRLICPSGTTDCTVTCANTQTDANNCGACGNRCRGGRVCSAGVCACPTGQVVCGDSCVDTQTNASNCGACGTVCPSGPRSTAACVAGRCGIVCDQGFGNCDGAVSTGCEVDLNANVSHCGGCGLACGAANGTASCSGGTCGITCASGRANCNGYLADGCEVDTTTSLANCGGCGVACAVAHGTPQCSAGVCRVGSCTAPWANCNGNVADGCEIDTSNDAYNCAHCGAVCGIFPAGVAGCGNSVCAYTTSDCTRFGLTECVVHSAFSCVNTQINPLHCGACNHACSSGQVCSAGVCVYPVPPNDLCASATVIDLTAGSRITLSATTLSATHNLDAPCNGVGGADVFYRFTLTRREYVYADTLASPGFDTRLFFASSCTAALTTRTSGDLVCNDNGGSGCGATGVVGSQVFTVLPAGTYYLVLSAQSGSSGTATLRFEHLPAGDGTVTALAQGSSTPSGTTAGTDGARGSCGGTAPENSYWWVTCPSSTAGAFSATTCGRATWNTLLYVLNGAGTGDACNNDGTGTCGARSSLSATIPAGAGLHALYVDGLNDGGGASSGTYTVAVTRP